MRKSQLSKNLKFLRDKNNWQQGQMRSICGISGATWSNYENGVSKPNLEKVLKISKIFGVTINDLLEVDLEHANENQLSSNKLSSPKYTEYNVSSLVKEPPPLDNPERKNVIFVPVSARADYVKNFSDKKFIESLPMISDPLLGEGTYRLWEVEGNSMLNTFHNGDKALTLLDLLQNIINDKVYILVTKSNGILLKRCINNRKEKKIICKSDNNQKGEYPPITVDDGDVKEVWQVVENRSRLFDQAEIYKRVADLEADMLLLKNKLLKNE